jgi:Flp pilus assembly protein TadD
VAAYEAGDVDTAAARFAEAVRLEPGNSQHWLNLGVARSEQGDDLRAFHAYSRAVELNPREIQAYLNMGYLFMERERANDAREVWEHVVRVAPESEEAAEARRLLTNAEEI